MPLLFSRPRRCPPSVARAIDGGARKWRKRQFGGQNQRAATGHSGGRNRKYPNPSCTRAQPHGLHARPAKQLVQIARAQAMSINVRLEEGSATPVSAASLTKVIGLGARRGQWLVLSAEGDGAQQALENGGNN